MTQEMLRDLERKLSEIEVSVLGRDLVSVRDGRDGGFWPACSWRGSDQGWAEREQVRMVMPGLGGSTGTHKEAGC